MHDGETPDQREDEPAASEGSEAPEPGGTPRTARPAGGGFGASLRRLAKAAGEVAEAGAREAGARARDASEGARPEAERLARRARAAAEAARPHLERGARDAARYVREHDDDIRRAAKRSASVTARLAADLATPGPLRPAVHAFEDELRTKHPNVARPPDPLAPEDTDDPEQPDGGARPSTRSP